MISKAEQEQINREIEHMKKTAEANRKAGVMKGKKIIGDWPPKKSGSGKKK